jgi:hypothetical protein
VKLALRMLLATSLLGGMAMVAGIAPAFASAPAHDTVVVTCSNGFSRTVSAHAARGVATSLSRFNAYNHSNVTCAAGAGATRTAPTQAWLTISCSNGFERRVSAHAAGGIARALNAYNAHNHRAITCSAA